MATYAADTQVSAEKSRAEIEATLGRYGAVSFAYGWSGDRVMIGFTMEGRQIRFNLEMPDRNDKRFTHTPARGNKRTTGTMPAMLPALGPGGPT